MSELNYIRDSKKPIYVSTEMFRALWLLSKAYTLPEGSGRPVPTPDSLTDQFVREVIEKYHPEVLEHLEREDKATKELIAQLQKK